MLTSILSIRLLWSKVYTYCTASYKDIVSGTRTNCPALLALLPAIIGAVGAAAGGIAGAVGQGEAAKKQENAADADRVAREKLAKMQIEEQKRQALEQRQMAAQQGLLNSYDQAATGQREQAKGRMAARTDIQNTLAKAFLGE